MNNKEDRDIQSRRPVLSYLFATISVASLCLYSYGVGISLFSTWHVEQQSILGWVYGVELLMLTGRNENVLQSVKWGGPDY